MQSLMWLSLLGAVTATAEPVVIAVPSHALATAAVNKGQVPATDLVERAAHAMSARIDVDGRVHYGCADAAATNDFRFDTRPARREK